MDFWGSHKNCLFLRRLNALGYFYLEMTLKRPSSYWDLFMYASRGSDQSWLRVFRSVSQSPDSEQKLFLRKKVSRPFCFLRFGRFVTDNGTCAVCTQFYIYLHTFIGLLVFLLLILFWFVVKAVMKHNSYNCAFLSNISQSIHVF